MGSLVQNVGSLLGGGPNNAAFQASTKNLATPVTNAAAENANASATQGVTDLQHLIAALQAQHGIQNQSNVYNQVQGVANGTGPNPAQAMLNQATGQNVANQAALMAGQRGASANPGLIAREIAQQGAATQQQAAGQGATLQANQQLGALGQLGGLASQQVAQQQQATQGFNQAAQGNQANLLNAINAQNNQNLQAQNINSQMAQHNASSSGGALGGLLNAAGPAVLGMFTGGAGAALPAAAPLLLAGSKSSDYTNLGDPGSTMASYQNLAKGGTVPNPKVAAVSPERRFSGALAPHIEHMAKLYHADTFARGGKVPALVSPGEVYLPPAKAEKVVKEGKNPLKEGEKIPGKAAVKGDSLKNDTVPKTLESGGIVIPRSVMESDDPAGEASKFVQALMKKKGSGKDHAQFKEALKKAISSRKAS